jgi:hypothetical protein
MRLLFLCIILILSCPLFAGLVISEVAPSTSGDDWVEIFYDDPGRSSIDISKLYVTMYYGTNEPLSKDPVTIYSYDRPETPYDDRYVVVHLTAPNTPDETDYTGDTNHNGRIDLYCNNYSGSLWNSECVVALDTNDDPSDGMIDFAAWSADDGSPSGTILGYLESAIRAGKWQGSVPANQSMMIPVPKGGIESYQSISRMKTQQINSLSDFAITNFMTPGSPNLFSNPSTSKKIFSVDKSRITVIPGHFQHRAESIVSVFSQCDLRMRVFSDIGQLVYDTGRLSDIAPGKMILEWKNGDRAKSGLYIAQIEGSIPYERRNHSKKIFFIVTRYK